MFVLSAAPAHAEDKPVRGSWKRLAVRTVHVAEGAHVDGLEQRALDLVRALRPEGARIADLKVSGGGDDPVRVSFKATTRVDVSVGPIRVTKDESFTVRARVGAERARCAADGSRPGYNFRLDLSESDEPVAANADALVLSVCRGATADTYELTTYMQIGPDYGTRVAGRLATDLLTRQTDPAVRAFQAVVAP